MYLQQTCMITFYLDFKRWLYGYYFLDIRQIYISTLESLCKAIEKLNSVTSKTKRSTI